MKQVTINLDNYCSDCFKELSDTDLLPVCNTCLTRLSSCEQTLLRQLVWGGQIL